MRKTRRLKLGDLQITIFPKNGAKLEGVLAKEKRGKPADF